MRRLLRFGFFVFSALATNGCATAALLDAAREADVTDYRASHLDSAWRAEDGELVLCIYGWPTGVDTAEPPQRFGMVVPAGALAQLPVPAEAIYGERTVLTWRATLDRIEPDCRAPPESALRLPMEWRSALVLDEAGREVRQPLHELLALADLEDARPAMHIFDDAAGPGMGEFVYQHDAPLPGGARFVRLLPPREERYDYNAAILLLPVAVTVDVAIFVGYLYLCAQSPGAC